MRQLWFIGFFLAIYLPSLMLAGAVSATENTTEETQVPVITLDSDQNAILKSIPLSHYTESLQTSLSAVQDSALPVLENHVSASPAQKLKLQTVGIGVSITGQLGIGPIWNVSVTPRFRLIFTNSKNPVYPVYN